MPRLLIIGSGITGALIVRLLKKESTVRSMELVVWEKAKQSGGRMLSLENSSNSEQSVDLGAQYITTSLETLAAHAHIYDGFRKSGILKPLEAIVEGMRSPHANTLNFVAPKGIGSLVEHCLEVSDVTVNFNQTLASLCCVGPKWIASSKEGHTDEFDHVIITIPVPQVLKLEGDIKEIIANQSDVMGKLKGVEYSSRYALALFYTEPQKLFSEMPWSAKYFPGGTICFVSIENKKRGAADGFTSLVVHSSVRFGLDHSYQELDEIESLLISHLKSLFPDLPEPDDVICHKWELSQVSVPYTGSPGCLLLNKYPTLLLGGDSFTRSCFDGCLESAVKLVQKLTALLPVD